MFWNAATPLWRCYNSTHEKRRRRRDALPADSNSAPLFSAKGAVGASQFLLPVGEG
jgi:hypothetical protein